MYWMLTCGELSWAIQNSPSRDRSPRSTTPRRVGSSYLLSGLVKCKTCNRALSGQDSKSGQFSYYVCQSLMKRGSGACDTPRLSARRFKELVVGKIRSNILTDGSIRALVKVVDEEMDGVTREQRERLESIDGELEEVKKQLGRVWHFIAKSDSVDVAEGLRTSSWNSGSARRPLKSPQRRREGC